jgi:hypothetical protein
MMRPVAVSRLAQLPFGAWNWERSLTAPLRPGPFGGFVANGYFTPFCRQDLATVARHRAAPVGNQNGRLGKRSLFLRSYCIRSKSRQMLPKSVLLTAS